MQPITPRPLTLVAHRGGAQLAPENTMAAFSVGLAMGADALECDVHLSADGVPVLIHDPTMERTTGATGQVSNYTWQELQTIKIANKGNYPDNRQFTDLSIPSLDKLVAFAANAPIDLFIEIKLRQDHTRYPFIEQRVIDNLRKHTMIDRSTIICFNFDILRLCKELEPSLKTSALIWRGGIGTLKDDGSLSLDAIVDEIRSSRADSAGVSDAYLSQELTNALHTGGLGVGVWTVNDPDRMRSFISMGVDSLTSDRPDYFSLFRQGT